MVSTYESDSFWVLGRVYVRAIGKIQIDASISGVRAERRGRPMGFVSEDLMVSDDLAGSERADGVDGVDGGDGTHIPARAARRAHLQ